MSIGWNITAVLQVRENKTSDGIGACEYDWVGVSALKGWLDLSSGDSKHNVFNAKVQESSHIFLCDFTSLRSLSTGWLWDPFNFKDGIIRLDKSDDWKWSPFSFISGNIANYENRKIVDATSENARLVVQGAVYEILLIDDPMNMNEHLEIYLRFIGGQ